MQRILAVCVAFVVTVSLPVSAKADEVTDWTRMMLQAGVMVGNSPTVITHQAAMLNVAIFDAVNGVDPKYTYFFVQPAATAGASKRAAAAKAAHTVLSKLYGSGVAAPNATNTTLQGAFDSMLKIALNEIGEDESQTAINDGVAWGLTVANAVMALREKDGFTPIPPATSFPPFPDDLTVGKWRRTPNLPASATALSPAGAGYVQFSHQTPWALQSYDQFRPGPPLALSSPEYAKDFNETKEMGSFSSTKRTPDQTDNSIFWAMSTGTFIWNDVAMRLIEEQNKFDDNRDDRWDSDSGRHRGHRGRLLDNARLMAQLNVASADAIIGCWDSKYIEAFWRPVTAIRDPNDDGNPATTSDPNWMPLLVTPGHPEYPSGHSCASGAAGEILSQAFGDRTTFTVTNDLLPGVTRKYRSFSSALEEVKNARIYAGIHFRTACDTGQALGINVARYVLETKFQRLR